MTTDSDQIAAAGARLSIDLPPGAQAATMARQATRLALTSLGLDHLKDSALLLVSELVGNAVRHAHGGPRSVDLLLAGDGDLLRIEVIDTDPIPPQARVPDVLDEDGFGLVLVQALADGWGVRPVGNGKAVWFELRITPTHTGPPPSSRRWPATGPRHRAPSSFDPPGTRQAPDKSSGRNATVAAVPSGSRERAMSPDPRLIPAHRQPAGDQHLIEVVTAMLRLVLAHDPAQLWLAADRAGAQLSLRLAYPASAPWTCGSAARMAADWLLIDSLATRWGCTGDRDWHTLWAVLASGHQPDLSGSQRRPPASGDV